MYIKSLIIEGFKSYKNKTVVDFSPEQNVVVGKNGSGKSNIFFAIQFLLSNSYSTIRSEERQQLLHEGTGRAVMSAYVEVIFDNSDGRIPMDEQEVSLKRAIGLKKDEYFVNNKHTSKQDVDSLLESAGLSRSNPYYIVAQGRVTQIIKMKDSQRLDLLKEIAGTRVYDERRRESLKIMQDTENRRNQIQEIIGYIETRLSELTGEKNELQKWEEKDRARRAIEYNIYDKELQHGLRELSKIEENRDTAAEKSQELHGQVKELQEEIATMEQEQAELEQSSSTLAMEKTRLIKDRRETMSKKENLRLRVEEQVQALTNNTSLKKTLEQQLQTLRSRIEQEQTKLRTLEPAYQKKLIAEEKARTQLKEKESRLSDLYAKQDRNQKYTSKAERDKDLKNRIKSIKADLKLETKHAKMLASDIQAHTKEVAELKKSMQAIDKSKGEYNTEMQELDKKYRDLKEDRDKAVETRKARWKKKTEIQNTKNQCRMDLQKARKDFSFTMSRGMREGLENVRRIVNQKGIKGVYGPVIELFTCEPRFRVAVEATAGNRLFHWVVDTDETASRVLKYLEKERGGRVTLMPLNRLRVRNINYPTSCDALPLIKKLDYADVIHPAINQIFGNTMICRSLQVASNFARRDGFDTITLHGDSVNKKGAMTGGWQEQKRSRLELFQLTRELHDKLTKVETEEQACDGETGDMDAEVQRVMSMLRTVEVKKTDLREKRHHADTEVRMKGQQLKLQKDMVTQKERQLRAREQQVKSLTARQVQLSSEIGSKLSAELNSKEQKERAQCVTQIDELNKELAKVSSARIDAQSKMNQVKELLQTNLSKQEEMVANRLKDLEDEVQGDELENQQHALKQLEEVVQELDTRLKDCEKRHSAEAKKHSDMQDILEKRKEAEKKLSRKLHDASKSTEKLVSKRITLQNLVEDSQTKIRGLGSLPQEARAKYNKFSVEQLMKKLSTTNKALKKFSNVNKKALDQYQSFSEQRVNLMARKAEQDKGKKAIEELIDHLDKKKDEAIQRTYKSIAKHFSIVFQELVPKGQASFVMFKRKNSSKKRKRGDNDEYSDDEIVEAKGPSGAESYTGCGIRVQFADQGDVYSMKQLSGGQQTVVALSLVFSIQRCDPSPFYLFDEIDAALDAVYRTAVANLIHAESSKSQFICTTFRSEMIFHAERFLGVTYQNKVSQVAEISQEEAQAIIQSEEQAYQMKE